MLFGKSSKEPGTTRNVVDVIVGIGVGAALAVVALIFKPVVVADTHRPSDPDFVPERHHVVYVRGKERPVRLSTWRANQKAFLEQSEDGIEIAEQDLNRWIAKTYGRKDRRIELESYGIEIRPFLPLFRFNEDVTEVGLISDIEFGEKKLSFVVQARGSLEAGSNGLDFRPDELYLGSYRVPAPLRKMVYDSIAGVYPMPENTEEPFAAIASAEVSGGKLRLGFSEARTSSPAIVENSADETPAEATQEPVDETMVAAIEPTTETEEVTDVQAPDESVAVAADENVAPNEGVTAGERATELEQATEAESRIADTVVATADEISGSDEEANKSAPVDTALEVAEDPTEVAATDEPVGEPAVDEPVAETAAVGSPEAGEAPHTDVAETSPVVPATTSEEVAAAESDQADTPATEGAPADDDRLAEVQSEAPNEEDFLSEEYSEGLADNR